MHNQRLQDLFDQYLATSMTKDELGEFLDLLTDCEASDFDYLVDQHLEKSQSSESVEVNKGVILQRILQDIEPPKRKLMYPIFSTYGKWMGLIAACLLVVFGITYFIKDNQEQQPIRKVASNDIRLQQGIGPKILRTDGKEFQITKFTKVAIQEEGLIITNDDKGNRLFKLSKAPVAVDEFRTFITPKGSSLQLEFEDGTRIWMNSGASVTYPAAFSEDQRLISVVGEVFLDVSPDKNRPFIIQAKQTKIKVLGTQFNVHSDKSTSRVETTLIEGSVEVQRANQRKILKPGFKSVSFDNNQDIAIQKADLKSILAWKDGYFRFNRDRIETVMGKIEQWYDIDQVHYLRKSNDEFSGMIKRTTSLSELLKQMEKISNYKFEIQDGRVLIM